MADTVKVQSDLDPLEGIDSLRLENEMKNYQQWMDERTEDAYRIAEIAFEKPRLQTICGNTKGCRFSWQNREIVGRISW